MKKEHVILGWLGVGCATFIALLVSVVIILWFLWGSFDPMSPEHRKKMYDSPSKIEKTTGIRLPNFKVVEYKEGILSFNGDYFDSIIIEFETDIPEDTYLSFRQRAEELNTKPHNDYPIVVLIEEMNYSYSDLNICGNDEFIIIHITKGSRTGEIQFGCS